MKKIFYFLGSIYFAVLLIAWVALFVIFGTFVESYTQSHFYASSMSYSHPFFKALLWGFFINILFSALRRWPFKWRHVPFLITHFGLLMILSGCIIKGAWGTQGTMLLYEGSGSHEIYIPHTHVVKIDKRGKSEIYDPQKGRSPFPELEIEVLRIAPNATEKIATAHSDDVESLVVYDGGFAGYAAQEKIVVQKTQGEMLAILQKELQRAVENQAKLSKPLEILHQACLKAKADFPKTAIQYLIAWNQAGSWLYPETGADFAAEKYIEIPEEFKKGCAWANALFDDHDTLKSLEAKGCPVPKTEKPLTTLTQQLFSADNLLPNPPEAVCRPARLLSVLFQAYEMHLNDIKPLEEVVIQESPITIHHKELPASLKWEENNPMVTLKLKKGEKEEVITLVYNQAESGIKIPAFDHEYLFRYMPKMEQIPYRVRLHNARQINYANSTQPFSFEADLLLTHRGSLHAEDKTISMNHVHETWEGYRFYLSNISPPDETAVKRIQLAVNHDPAKYWLTYPGGLIVALGSVLLFITRIITLGRANH